MTDSRRIATVLLTPAYLIETHKASTELSWTRCKSDPLPPDATVVDVYPDAEHKGVFVILLQSETFDVVPDGCEPPNLPIPILERVFQDSPSLNSYAEGPPFEQQVTESLASLEEGTQRLIDKMDAYIKG